MPAAYGPPRSHNMDRAEGVTCRSERTAGPIATHATVTVRCHWRGGYYGRSTTHGIDPQ